MKTAQIHGATRTDMGKQAAKHARAEGQIPCVLYSEGKAVHFSAPVKELNALIYTPETFLVDLHIEGKSYLAVIKHASFHPVHDFLMDIEFHKVYADRPLQVDIPLKLTGTSEGVLAGGRLVQKQRKLRVRGLYKDIPDSLSYDITNLRLGRSIKVADVEFDNLIVDMIRDVPIATVEITRQLRQERGNQ